MEQHNQNHLTLVSTSPYTRCNDRWPINDLELLAIINNNTPNENFRNFNDIFGYYNDSAREISQQSVVHLVSETVFHYPNFYISEKTYKPIINKRPFLLLSSCGSLKNLRDMGFKTFSDFWDESYDSVYDPADRLVAVIDILESLCNRPFDELIKMLDDMNPILEYNYNYYKNQFKNKELEKFELACRKNLGRQSI